MQAWLKNGWGKYVESIVRDASPDIFDRSSMKRLIDGQRKGYANSARLYALTMFELWRREYQVSL